jgi:hypothetical protein
MDPLLFLGSLFAILALAGIARWLELGVEPSLETEEDVRRAASEAIDGFEPTFIDLDFYRRGALVEDAEGRIMLLRRHGNFTVGRLLGPQSSCINEVGLVTIDTGEPGFREVTLELIYAGDWERAINRLRIPDHA